MKNNNSAISLCQPSCGYYFSSGCYVSETVYSGNSESPHSPLYNAASRVVIDGGRKAVAYIAMAGMFAQNLEIAAYAETTAPSAGIYHAVMSYDSGAQISGMNPDSSTSWTIIGNVASNFILKNQWLNVKSGGSAFNTVLSSGGKLNISNGAVASNATVSSGGQINIKSGGSLHIATATAGGAINISAGGSAAGIKQESGGNVNVVVKYMPGIAGTYISGTNQDNGIFGLNYYTYGGAVTQTAVASNFIINSSGWQNVSSGGSSLNTVINGGGTVNVYSSGYTSDTTVYGGGSMYVYDGGVADTTTVNGGTLNIRSGGTANYASVSSGGTMNISRGGSANYASANSSGIINVSNGGTANYTVINATGTQNVYGSSISTTINSLGSQVVYSGGVADTTTVNNGGWQFIESSGTASNTVISSGGQQIISSGGLSISATIDSGGSQHIKPAGIASDTTINIGGWQFVSSGGSAINNIILSGASQTVESGGVVSNTVIESGGSQATSGDTSGMIISGGSQIVSSGATDTDATIYDGGVQHILDGGRANSAHVNSGGTQIISFGGSAKGTVVNSGTQFISEGGIADNTTVNSGGIQAVFADGIASSTIVSSGGFQNVYESGSANGTVLNSDGMLSVLAGGKATGITQNSGGKIIATVASDDGIEISGSYYASTGATPRTFTQSDGIANGFVIEGSGAVQSISTGGSAVGTTVNSYGIQSVDDGGFASDAIVNSFGIQNIGLYAVASDTIVNSGGSQNVNGSSYYAVVNSGGSQNVNDGALAQYTVVMPGGSQAIQSGGKAENNIVFHGAVQNVNDGATNSNLVSDLALISDTSLSSGATQSVGSGYGDYRAIISDGGTQSIDADGFAIKGDIFSGGTQIVSSGAYSVDFDIHEGGVMSVLPGGSAINVLKNSGGNINVDIGGTGEYAKTSITAYNPWNQHLIVSNGSAIGFHVNSGGSINVYESGLFDHAIVNSGGYVALSGGSSMDVTIFEGGSMTVGTSGYAFHNVIMGNAQMDISSGGVASNLGVNPYARLIMSPGASATSVYLSQGGIIHVTVANDGTLLQGTSGSSSGSFYVSNGSASGFMLWFESSQLDVKSGGSALGIKVYSGAAIQIDGGYASNISLGNNLAGNKLYLNSGLAYSTFVGNYGKEYIDSGGVAISDTVQAKAYQYVSSGGTASGAKLIGGSQTVYAGGTANSTVISGYTNSTNGNFFPALQEVHSGGIIWNDTISSGGSVYVYGDNTLHGDTVLQSGGQIHISRKTEAPLTAVNLSVENLITDGGTFYLNADLSANTAENNADRIIITSSHTGSANIVVSNVGTGDPVAIESGDLPLVEYAAGATIAEDASFTMEEFDDGGYTYSLSERTLDAASGQQYYYLLGTLNNTGNGAGSLPNVNAAGTQAALNSLQKRLGDLRGMADGQYTQGIWGRSYYRNATIKAISNIEMDVSGLEAGWDFKAVGDNTSTSGLYLGLMAGSMNISAEDGKGDGDGMLGGMYATYIAEDGWFADFTLRGGQTEIDVVSYTHLGNKLTISPERTFVAASIEAGRTINVGGQKSGWKIEPKAELRYMGMGAKTAEARPSNDKIRYGGADYITGAGTLYLGYMSERKSGLKTEPFAEITYSYEFDGKEKTKYGNRYLPVSDMSGYSVEARLGVNMQLTSSLYWHAAANWEDGHSQKSYGADAGIRYMFGGK